MEYNENIYFKDGEEENDKKIMLMKKIKVGRYTSV